MLRHSQVNSLPIVTLKRALDTFVKRVTSREGIVHTGIIQEVTNSGGSLSNIIIEMTDVEGSPHLSWSDSHFIIQESDVFVVDDPVLLLPIRGRFLIIKIEDDFVIPAVQVARGTSSVGNMATTVTHSLGVVPDASDISIVFTEGSSGAMEHWFIDTITSTQFNINTSGNPGEQVDFAWKVDIR